MHYFALLLAWAPIIAVYWRRCVAAVLAAADVFCLIRVVRCRRYRQQQLKSLASAQLLLLPAGMTSRARRCFPRVADCSSCCRCSCRTVRAAGKSLRTIFSSLSATTIGLYYCCSAELQVCAHFFAVTLHSSDGSFHDC